MTRHPCRTASATGVAPRRKRQGSTAWYGAPSGTGLRFIANTAIGGDWPGNPGSSTWVTADDARYVRTLLRP
jgi:hypothetical protein